MATRIKIVNTLTKGIHKYTKIAGVSRKKPATGANLKAEIAVGLTLLNWIGNGSKRLALTPPIKDGILRGSGSIFVDSRFYGDSKQAALASQKGTPAQTYSGKPNVVTVGYNTAYAARMHETDWSPGETSLKSGNVGNKFIEKHLLADRKDLTAVYAKVFKKASGG